MPRPEYSNVTKEYRGNIAELRHRLDRVYDWLLRSPKAKPDVQQTVVEFGEAAGIDFAAPLPATQVVVSEGAATQVRNAANSANLVAGTAKVAAGALTGVSVAATVGVVTNGQSIAVTGGTVTISVANNVVTAAYTATP